MLEIPGNYFPIIIFLSIYSIPAYTVSLTSFMTQLPCIIIFKKFSKQTCMIYSGVGEDPLERHKVSAVQLFMGRTASLELSSYRESEFHWLRKRKHEKWYSRWCISAATEWDKQIAYSVSGKGYRLRDQTSQASLQSWTLKAPWVYPERLSCGI